MKAIYDADQAARDGGDIDWRKLGPEDAKRRERTRKLIMSDALHTGRDFQYAAFIFQHADNPGDYLFAHTLAMVALEKGDDQAVWIATATLDRYLQAIQQKQIYGTQFSMPNAGQSPPTQEPYDRNLIPDSLRVALRVPTLSGQAKEGAEMEGRRATRLAAMKAREPAPSAPVK